MQNQEASNAAPSHPSGLASNEEDLERVLFLTRAGVKPGTFVASLRNGSSINATAQDIYNIHNNDRAEKLQG